MIFQCDDLERALRSPELMPDALAHAGHCEYCGEELYLWSEISRIAPQLHHEWESPSLWPRIRADLEATAPARRPVPFWQWLMATAALLAMALALSLPWNSGKPQSREFLTEEALHNVQQAEAAYARSIEKLSVLASPRLERSHTPLAAVYREKLVVLDAAIADLKANVAGNQYNVYVQNQLASLYREKQKTLEEWLENATRN
jgi:hypothetical protein